MSDSSQQMLLRGFHRVSKVFKESRKRNLKDPEVTQLAVCGRISCLTKPDIKLLHKLTCIFSCVLHSLTCHRLPSVLQSRRRCSSRVGGQRCSVWMGTNYSSLLVYCTAEKIIPKQYSCPLML